MFQIEVTKLHVSQCCVKNNSGNEKSRNDIADAKPNASLSLSVNGP